MAVVMVMCHHLAAYIVMYSLTLVLKDSWKNKISTIIVSLLRKQPLNFFFTWGSVLFWKKKFAVIYFYWKCNLHEICKVLIIWPCSFQRETRVKKFKTGQYLISKGYKWKQYNCTLHKIMFDWLIGWCRDHIMNKRRAQVITTSIMQDQPHFQKIGKLDFSLRKHYTIIAALKVNIIIVHPWDVVFPPALLYWNSIYNNVGCNKHLFVCFYLVFS